MRPLARPPPPAPHPGGGVGDYASRLRRLNLSLDADPRIVKPGLHPLTLGAGSGDRAAAMAAAARAADAMPDFGDDELDVNSDTGAVAAAVDALVDVDEAAAGSVGDAVWEAARPLDAGPSYDDPEEPNEEDDAWALDDMSELPLGGRGGGRAVGAAAAAGFGADGDDDADIDLITGERITRPPSTVDPADADLVAATASAGPFAAAFRGAARALQARLVAGVRAEMDAAVERRAAMYAKNSVESLVADGVVLRGLTATRAGVVFGDVVLTLALPARSATATAAAAGAEDAAAAGAGAGADAGKAARRSKARGALAAAVAADIERREGGAGGRATRSRAPRDPLPAHRFGARDPVLLAATAADGATPLAGARGPACVVEASVLDVAADHLVVGVRAEAADAVDALGAHTLWRLDAAAPDSTATRQLRALASLDRPWGEVASRASEVWDEAAAAAAAREADAAPASLSPLWAPGELRVRSILLGDPDARTAADTPPDWARDGGWRQDVGALLAEADNLNPSQREAIASALASTLTLWQGPPGTGKTRALVALLATLARASRKSGGSGASAATSDAVRSRSVPALACGDTNAAADARAAGLAAAGVRVVRMGGAAKAAAEVAPLTLEAQVAATPAGREAASLRARAAAAAARSRAAQTAGDADAASTCRADASSMRRAAAKLEDDAGAAVMAAAEVVCATTAGAGDGRRLGAVRFRSVVLDEATQATEPSSFVPLVRGAEWVVLAGDPRQLPPTVASAGARGAGLDQTLFERLQRGGLDPVLLDTQYRMHPALAAFPSARFYGGRLKDGVPATPSPAGFPWPAPSIPLALIDVDDGMEDRGAGGAGGGSVTNPREAALALRAAGALAAGGDVDSVVILSPYAGQVRLLKALLRDAPEEVRSLIKVSTVDGFQGREADAVVLTTVRCNPAGSLGFVADGRRMNVALTRGRRGAVVVGAPGTLSSDADWRVWLDHVTEAGALLPGGALAPLEWEPDEAVAALARGGAVSASWGVVAAPDDLTPAWTATDAPDAGSDWAGSAWAPDALPDAAPTAAPADWAASWATDAGAADPAAWDEGGGAGLGPGGE